MPSSQLGNRPAPTQNAEAYDLYLPSLLLEQGPKKGAKSLEFCGLGKIKFRPGPCRDRQWNWLADAYVRPMDASPK
jgi:hypothetical protein